MNLQEYLYNSAKQQTRNHSTFLFGESRTYIKSPSEAPAGVAIKRGARGGLYYDSLSAQKKVSPKINFSFVSEPPVINLDGKLFDIGQVEMFTDEKGTLSEQIVKNITDSLKESEIHVPVTFVNRDSYDSGGFVIAEEKHRKIYITGRSREHFRKEYLEACSEYDFKDKKEKMKLLQDLSTEELFERCIFHEYGHIKTFEKFGNFNQNTKYWKLVAAKNPKFKKYFEQCVELIENEPGLHFVSIFENIFKKNQLIGEIIAEDFALVFARKMGKRVGDTVSPYFAKDQAAHEEKTLERQELLYKILMEDD